MSANKAASVLFAGSVLSATLSLVVFVSGANAQTNDNRSYDNSRSNAGAVGPNSSQALEDDTNGNGGSFNPNCVGFGRNVIKTAPANKNNSRSGDDSSTQEVIESPGAGSNICFESDPTAISDSKSDARSQLQSEIANALRNNSEQNVVTALAQRYEISTSDAQSLVNETNQANVQKVTNGGSPVYIGGDKIKYEAPKRPVYPANINPGSVVPGTSGQRVRLNVDCPFNGSVTFEVDVYAANESQDIRGGLGLPFLSIQGGYTRAKNGRLQADPVPATETVATLSSIRTGELRRNNCGEPKTPGVSETPEEPKTPGVSETPEEPKEPSKTVKSWE
jgi:hypothetical protein